MTQFLETLKRFSISPNNRIFLALMGGIVLLLCSSLPIIALAGFQVLDKVVPTAPPTLTGALQTITPTGSPAPVAVCGGPPAMFILLAGTDARSDSYQAGLADSMRIVRVDFINPGIMHVALLRDLYVEIPGIADHGITHGKLNQAYLYATPSFGYYENPDGGAGLLSLTLEHNFGVHVDHYAIVNMQSFIRIVDALGGIDVNLPYTVDGRVTRSLDPNLYFPAGGQHLDGYHTLLLARLRPQGDFLRSNTQNLILGALAEKILSPAMLPALPDLITTWKASVQTDLEEKEIGQLLCLAAMLDSPKVQAMSFPEDIFTGTRVNDPVLGRTFVWDVDFNLLRSYLEYFINGTWPETPLTVP